MASFQYLILDTTSPSNPTVVIDNNATYTSSTISNLKLSMGDESSSGYTMKIWGDLNTSDSINNGLGTSENNASWITYATSKQVKWATGDGRKDIYFKVRDHVLNESSIASENILLDTTMPEVTMSPFDVTTVSHKTGKNLASFSFQSNSDFVEYKVMVVNTTNAVHTAGTLIANSNGSSNMNGTGSFTKDTPINCTINSKDLENASNGDSSKCVKVFVKDHANLWSV